MIAEGLGQLNTTSDASVSHAFSLQLFLLLTFCFGSLHKYLFLLLKRLIPLHSCSTVTQAKSIVAAILQTG